MGLGYHRRTDTALAATHTKRHASYGPNGPGAIYRVSVDGVADGSLFLDLNAATSNAAAGTLARGTNGWDNDTDAYANVGKIGLGDLDVAEDDSEVYTIGLNDKKLYVIPVTPGSNPPTAGTPVGHAIPDPTGCAAGFDRPYAISVKDGKVFVGVTCTGPNVADLEGYVYSFDGATFNATPILTFPLDYPRLCGDRATPGGVAWPSLSCSDGGTSSVDDLADYRAWSDTFDADFHGGGTVVCGTGGGQTNGIPSGVSGCGFGGRPQPWFTDMTWDGNNLTLGIRDRYGDQIGYNDTDPDPATPNFLFRAFGVGDILRACDVSGTLTFESGGSCGGITTRGGLGVGQGTPALTAAEVAAYDQEGNGAGEYYWDDRRAAHDESSFGGLAQIPGAPTVAMTALDATNLANDGGVTWMTHSDGSRNKSVRLYDTDGGGTTDASDVTFAKASGLGDIEAMCDMAPLELGNRVFRDTNGNGRQDAGEAGIGSVTVRLFEGATLRGTTTTNGSGEYAFNATNVSGGVKTDTAYTIRVDNAADYTGAGPLTGLGLTYVDAPTVPDLIDSDATSTGATDKRISVTTGAMGETRHDLDFGFTTLGSIGDQVFWDFNNDSTYQVGEGIPGVTVELRSAGADGTLGTADDIVTSQLTSASGGYLFPDLPIGPYRVTVTTPPADSTNHVDPDGGGNSTSDVTLTQAVPDRLDQDFGYIATGEIGDTIYHDIDGSASPQAGEGLANVDVAIRWAGLNGTLGDGDDIVLTRTTNASGVYGATNLPFGLYQVTVDTADIPVGLGNTVDPDGGFDSTSQTTLTLADPVDLDQDFGYRGTASIGDRVWWDRDDDGVQDLGEPGIPGVDVDVVWFGPDGLLGGGDDLTYPTVTGVDGIWNVIDLPAGNYRATVDTADLPTGLSTQTYDLDGLATPNQATTTLTTGQHRVDVDFGYRGLGTIGDTVWHDIDGDGTQDPGEPGIAGVSVRLVWGGPNATLGDGDDVLLNDVTDASGFYLFENLPAGPFRVLVDTSVPTALGLATNTGDPDTASPGDSISTLNLAVAEDNLDQDFGYQGTGELGDTIFWDLNGGGTPDAGEGLPNVDVTARWAGPNNLFGDGDDIVLTDTTDALGIYGFTGLPAGQFRVTVDTADLPVYLTHNTVDPDTADPGDSVSETSLAYAGVDLDQDFGYVAEGQIGDTVWHDEDWDGAYQIGEGLADINVTLTWAGPDTTFGTGDDVVQSQLTDSLGRYLFTALPSGGFRVTVATVGNAISALVLKNSVDPDGGLDSTSQLLLGVGASNLAQDFAYRRPVNDKMYYFNIGGTAPGQYNVIALTGALRLTTQQLVVNITGGFVPAVGDTWDVMTATSVTGDFSAVYGRLLPNGNVMKVTVLPDRVRLTVLHGIFVDTDVDEVDTIPGNGTCQSALLRCSLRAAVQEANALPGEDAIVLASGGLFSLTLVGADENGSATGDLDVIEAVSIVGPATTIDGVDADRVLHVLPAAAGVSVHGILIRNGDTTATAVPAAGCVFVDGGTATLTDVTLDNCKGAVGGAFGSLGGSSTFVRGTVRNSTASTLGGGVAAYGNTFMDATTVRDNTSAAFGGGVTVADSLGPATLTLVNAFVRDNDAAGVGGGLTTVGPLAQLNMSRTVVSGNTAATGGGIHVNGVAIIRDSRINFNVAQTGAGGGLFVSAGPAPNLTLLRTSVDGNTAATAGGGISTAGTLALLTSTVSNNTAATGGGIANLAGGPSAATVVDSTITNNRTTSLAGAVQVSVGTLSLRNSVVSNQALGGNCTGPVVSLGYNHASDGSCALAGTGDAQGASAQLGPLAQNGGFGPSHKPNGGSPLFNTGNPTCVGPDQRGWTRPRGGSCEKGSVEL